MRDKAAEPETAEVGSALEMRGWLADADAPMNVVGAALWNAAKKGRVQRLGGTDGQDVGSNGVAQTPQHQACPAGGPALEWPRVGFTRP